jgi:hypothetical protein
MTTKHKNFILVIIIFFIVVLLLFGGIELIFSKKPAPEIIYSQDPTEVFFENSTSKVENIEEEKEEKIKKGKIPLGVSKYKVLKDTTPTKQNNAMSSISGIPVSKGGDFDITINGVEIHVRSVSVLCPNEKCLNHTWGELNFNFLEDNAGPCVCRECKTPVFYSKNTIKTIYYNCPFCGLDEGSTCDWDNFCPNCGNDMRALNRALMNYNWESR